MGLSPEDSQHVVDSVALSWPYVGLALLGGLARACRFGVHSVKQFIGGLLCSGVSGLLCILALYDQLLFFVYMAGSQWGGGKNEEYK